MEAMTNYYLKSIEKAKVLKDKKDLVILGIETSCDETCASIMKGDKLLSNVISSQIEIHKRFGGVVPEIASRNHTMSISSVVKQSLAEAKISFADIDAIAVTYGAGLLGALIVGVSYAKALAFSLNVPLYAVSHIRGHICANYINSNLKPPYIALIVSGGHTLIAKVKDYLEIDILGTTLDDACGEAFDKVARLLGLPYPGGVEIQKLALTGENNFPLPTPFKAEKHYNFSFSGIKTAVSNYLNNNKNSAEQVKKEDIARSFEEKVVTILVEKTIRASKEYNLDTIVIAGGVGANTRLRDYMTKQAMENNIKVVYPPLILCTDNGAMICSCAKKMIDKGIMPVDINLDAKANVNIADVTSVEN